MKKLITIITCFVLAFGACFALVGCKKTNKKSSNSTENVISNGGMAVVKNDIMYFVDGGEENAKIYKVNVDENGEFLSAPTVFVKDAIANKNGSIHIFGDYLYYAALSTDKTSSGEVQSGIIKFKRIALGGGKAQVLYTTKSEDETKLQYAYYPSGNNDLYLVVYEGSKGTITSVDVGTNPTKSVIASDVTGVLLSENGNNEGANAYVYYTHAKDKTLSNQTGNVVERISPDGSNKTKISTKDVTYTLITIADNKLIYSDASYIFASSGELLSSQDDILSYLPSSTYGQIKYFGNKLVVLATINAESTKKYQIWQLQYVDGELQKTIIKNSADEKTEFICASNGKLYYSVDDLPYVIEITENGTNKKLSTTTVEEFEGYIAPEVIGGYLYFMHKDDGVQKAYRISIFETEATAAEKLV